MNANELDRIRKSQCPHCAVGTPIDIARKRRNEDGRDEDRRYVPGGAPLEPPQHIMSYTDYTSFNVPNKWSQCLAESAEVIVDRLSLDLAAAVRRAEAAEFTVADIRRDLAVATMGMETSLETTDEDRIDWLCWQWSDQLLRAETAERALAEAQKDTERLRDELKRVANGNSLASKRLREGYSHLHPGIDHYCDSFNRLGRDAEYAALNPTKEPHA